jgi:hypothetical protein
MPDDHVPDTETSMKATLFLRIQAIYLGAIGALSLLIPQAAGGQLGGLTAFDVFVARSLGAVLVTVAALNWVASSAPGPVLRSALWANVFMNVTLGLIDTIATANATISSSSWTGISFHALFTIGLLLHLVRGPRVAPAPGVGADGHQMGAGGA